MTLHAGGMSLITSAFHAFPTYGSKCQSESKLSRVKLVC